MVKKFFQLLHTDPWTDKTRSTYYKTKVILYVSIAAIMALVTVMNIVRGNKAMTLATIILSLAFAVCALLTRFTEKDVISSIIMSTLLVVCFTYFAISGTNDGFALLWVFMIPLYAMGFCGMTLGFYTGFCLQIIFLCIFYLPPFRAMIADKYTSIMLNRFPLLYFTAFMGATILMMQKHVQQIKQNQLTIEAESANRAKSSFLASMSHEIRTPLNAVLGMDEIIISETNDPLVLEHANDIKTAGNTLLSLINDILDFSKIESGKLQLNLADFHLSKLLSDEYMMLNGSASKKGLTFDMEIDPTLPDHLTGDEMRIKQILTNLLTNAIKYTAEGRILLKVDAQSRKEQEVTIHFLVKDTGMGIKAEDMDKLCETFVRLDEQKNRSVEGTGLGLSITSSLLLAMGSKLVVESTYGVGSEFSFDLTLPIMEAGSVGSMTSKELRAETTVTSAINTESFVAPQLRVMVVDDNAMNLKVFCAFLKKTQIQIDQATCCEEALDLFAKNDYDMLFIDYMMPNTDGVKTLALMKQMNADKLAGMVPIALTATTTEGAKEFFLENGFKDYLSKPFQVQSLLAMVRNYISDSNVCSTNLL